MPQDVHRPLLDLANPVPIPELTDFPSIADLCWYDGPVIFLALVGKQKYYLHMCECKQGSVPPTPEDYFIDRYLVVPISDREIEELQCNRLTLRDLLRRDDYIIVADAHWNPDADGNNPYKCYGVQTDSMPDDYFPKAGVYLDGRRSNEVPADV